jgi:hypothetical protein
VHIIANQLVAAKLRPMAQQLLIPFCGELPRNEIGLAVNAKEEARQPISNRTTFAGRKITLTEHEN